MHLYKARSTFRSSHKTVILIIILCITFRCHLCYQKFICGIPKTLENQNQKNTRAGASYDRKKKCFWSEKYFSTISVELCFMFISSKSKE